MAPSCRIVATINLSVIRSHPTVATLSLDLLVLQGDRVCAPHAPGDAPNPSVPKDVADSADLEHDAAADELLTRRRQLEEEARRDIAAARAGRRSDDLRPSELDGLMPDPEAREASWH
jgi:hypothetical protein